MNRFHRIFHYLCVRWIPNVEQHHKGIVKKQQLCWLSTIKTSALQIKIWQIPETGLKLNLTEWLVDLHGHTRRVGYVEWHPTAENILLSAGYDHKVNDVKVFCSFSALTSSRQGTFDAVISQVRDFQFFPPVNCFCYLKVFFFSVYIMEHRNGWTNKYNTSAQWHYILNIMESRWKFICYYIKRQESSCHWSSRGNCRSCKIICIYSKLLDLDTFIEV